MSDTTEFIPDEDAIPSQKEAWRLVLEGPNADLLEVRKLLYRGQCQYKYPDREGHDMAAMNRDVDFFTEVKENAPGLDPGVESDNP